MFCLGRIQTSTNTNLCLNTSISSSFLPILSTTDVALKKKELIFFPVLRLAGPERRRQVYDLPRADRRAVPDLRRPLRLRSACGPAAVHGILPAGGRARPATHGGGDPARVRGRQGSQEGPEKGGGKRPTRYIDCSFVVLFAPLVEITCKSFIGCKLLFFLFLLR